MTRGAGVLGCRDALRYGAAAVAAVHATGHEQSVPWASNTCAKNDSRVDPTTRTPRMTLLSHLDRATPTGERRRGSRFGGPLLVENSVKNRAHSGCLEESRTTLPAVSFVKS